MTATIRCNLKKVLEDQGLNPTRAARMAGLDYRVVRKWVNDSANQFSREALDNLCRVLDCTPADLLEYIPEKK